MVHGLASDSAGIDLKCVWGHESCVCVCVSNMHNFTLATIKLLPNSKKQI